MKKYLEIQAEVVQKYNIVLLPNSTCRSRTHAHCDGTRRVCKWKPANSLVATFHLFHEIGHIETKTSSMRRCESEYAATEWAIERFKEYELTLPYALIDKYQNYIFMELDRGLRRGGKNYPLREELTLKF